MFNNDENVIEKRKRNLYNIFDKKNFLKIVAFRVPKLYILIFTWTPGYCLSDPSKWKWRMPPRMNRIARYRAARFVRLLSLPLVLAFARVLPLRARNVRSADRADLLRPTNKYTADIPAHSQALREGGDSNAAVRSSAMDRRVFSRFGEWRSASGEGTVLIFVQTHRSRFASVESLAFWFPSSSPSSPSYFLHQLSSNLLFIVQYLCAILCFNAALKINIKRF